MVKKQYTDCEILAPAGSYKCMLAAFNAGADAVYAAGSRFGARAYAENFTDSELIDAIDYAHLRGKKLYIAINTLLKDKELMETLLDYVKPLYRAGLDAVIVQDLGVLKVLKENFADLNIHASTQMTVTGVNFAKELKNLGVSRIVSARELSLKEINDIYNATGLEIESFVHGALCYSYSGQCLMSSIIGGRSGNRGRCAQPCRLNYRLYENGQQINGKNESCLLSPKDLCTLRILPEILKSGVYSLKIEGRMKKPEYVFCVTAIYRKYVDMIKRGGAYRVDESDIEDLKEIYNRGGFTEGYYNKANGRDMISLYKPNHYGAKAAEVTGVTASGSGRNFCVTVDIKALKDIDKRDMLEINLKDNSSIPLILKDSIPAGARAALRADTKKGLSLGSLYERGVYRTRAYKLTEAIQNKIEGSICGLQLPARGFCRIFENENIYFKAETDISIEGKCITVCAEAEGSAAQKAKSRPLSRSEALKQLSKTGNTDFYFEDIALELGDNVFAAVTELNELRRNCLKNLRENILFYFRRKKAEKICTPPGEQRPLPVCEAEAERDISVDCATHTEGQLKQALKRDYIGAAAVELSSFGYSKASDAIMEIRKNGKRAYIALPYICRKRAIEEFKENTGFFSGEKCDYDGLIVRNYEELLFFADFFNKNKQSPKSFILDSGAYAFNSKTLGYIKELSERYKAFIMPTLPYELNKAEIEEMLKNFPVIKKDLCLRIEIYGYIPLMTSAGCLKNTIKGCDNSNSSGLKLKDRTNQEFPVILNCRYCYNSILNSVPLYLGGELEDIKAMNIRRFSVRFTVEDENAADMVLGKVEAALSGRDCKWDDSFFTRGHFKRGVG